MKTIIKIDIENTLDSRELAVVQNIRATTLDEVERYLKAALPGHYIYRGGNHVAVHFAGKSSHRLVLISEVPAPEIAVTKISRDVSGNSRRVIHFTALVTKNDRLVRKSVSELYELALKRSRAIGGKKYHNKQFGGGIAFQTDDDAQLRRDIEAITDLL